MTSSHTPMLKQYYDIKSQHADCILFFRLGDFYEMFGDDAKVVSKILDLVLTQRGAKGSAQAVPMCGFPHHASENYIGRLIKAGYKIAICEQMEDPATTKGLVKRDVTRIITAGTYLDEQSTATRYLLSVHLEKKQAGLAFCDPVTGTLYTNSFPIQQKQRLIEIIAKLPISECVYAEANMDVIKNLFENSLLKLKNIMLTSFEDWNFKETGARKILLDHFHVLNLHGFGIDQDPGAIVSTGALLAYLKSMNKQPLRHIDRIRRYQDEAYMFISPAAYRGLEFDQFIRTLDETCTAGGRRLFRHWCLHPLKNTEAIKKRQQAIQHLRDNQTILTGLHVQLSQLPDVEKNISRLSCGYSHPKDFLSIRKTLSLIPEIQKLLEPIRDRDAIFEVHDLRDLRQTLCAALDPNAPMGPSDGKLILSGYHQELDELRHLRSDARDILKGIQEREAKRTGINSLKIGYNKVFGYYIEITKTHSQNVPDDYIRKQTLTNAERYITPELKKHEEKLLSAQDKILAIERDILTDLHNQILDHSVELHTLCHQLARLDTVYGLTCLSHSPDYIQPHITDELEIRIEDGRHPVVERNLSEPFVPNDIVINDSDQHLIILTGPNMSGKSTYIRQTALLVILAQIGSHIPARTANIGVVDKIFTRIGAHDDISRGQSTFMVEMNETADILNNLSSRSLVILDEIGRGTSTFDGLSLAWALAEHLQTNKTRTLFATHFHEITALADKYSGVHNLNVSVKRWHDDIIFLHKIIPGGADDSYGIYVAQLAGIPGSVIQRAKMILTEIENDNSLRDQLKDPSALTTPIEHSEQLTFFPPPQDPLSEKVKAELKHLDINNLTPLEALKALHKMKNIMDSKPENVYGPR